MPRQRALLPASTLDTVPEEIPDLSGVNLPPAPLVASTFDTMPEDIPDLPGAAIDRPRDEAPVSFGPDTPHHVVEPELTKPEEAKSDKCRHDDVVVNCEKTSDGLGNRRARDRPRQARVLLVLRRLCDVLESEADDATKDVAKRGIAKKLAEDPHLMLPMLLSCLEGARATVREQAVEVIGLLEIQDLSTVAALIRILSADKAAAVRAMAAEALGSFRSQADLVVPALKCQYHMDESSVVTKSCAQSLAAFEVAPVGKGKADAEEGSMAQTGTPSLSDATDTASDGEGSHERKFECELMHLSENVVTFGDDTR